jgi:hypothetical protein
LVEIIYSGQQLKKIILFLLVRQQKPIQSVVGAGFLCGIKGVRLSLLYYFEVLSGSNNKKSLTPAVVGYINYIL